MAAALIDLLPADLIACLLSSGASNVVLPDRKCQAESQKTGSQLRLETLCGQRQHAHGSDACTQDAEIGARVLWENMLVVRPWFDMPPEVAAMEPEVLDDSVVRAADCLEDDQREVLTVSRAHRWLSMNYLPLEVTYLSSRNVMVAAAVSEG